MADVVVKGAREHNLKSVDLRFPRDRLVCFTGVSGSGKSSLAYDTIYKEGQRRFLESLSSYARQFMGRIEKPRVDHVEGLSPTVAIDQKSTSRNPRSTVGTITEVWDFLRLLMARLGTPRCAVCGEEVRAVAPEQIADEAMRETKPAETLLVLAPIVRGRKGSYRKELLELRQKGYVRARIDGRLQRLDEPIELERYVKHDIEVVLDRLKLDDASKRGRLLDSIAQALALADGLVGTLTGEGSAERYHLYSSRRACPHGHGALPELEPRLFSFNSPQGACPQCDGLGEARGLREDLLIADATKSIRDGGLACVNKKGFVHFTRLSIDHLDKVLRRYGGSADLPIADLPKAAREVLFQGSGDQEFEFRFEVDHGDYKVQGRDRQPFPGLMPKLQGIWDEWRPRALQRFQTVVACPGCLGRRLRPEALAVTFESEDVSKLAARTVGDLRAFLQGAWKRIEARGGNAAAIGRELFRELGDRLEFLDRVGLSYLSIDRSAATLSGGESQRIRLAAQVGSGLRGILYVLDEPSIGLHPRDNARLIATLRELRDRGNSVCIVEHDEETMRASDVLVDFGPGAGEQGGRIVAVGTPDEVCAVEESLTARYLNGEVSIEVPPRRGTASKFLEVRGASQHNLKDLDVRIPLERLVGVSGVSGSGKSSLVHHVLRRALARELQGAEEAPGKHDAIRGIEHLDKVIEIDQSPIGRTPRSNPATYSGVFDHIRDLYASLPESHARGYPKGRFSFNVKGGRCEECEGAGVRLLEMQFLEPVEVPCETCEGRRFNRETLEVVFKGRSIRDVLEMSVSEAKQFFAAHPKIHRILGVLDDVGLGYLRLGQTSTTLSGGEAQRVKLASELARPSHGRTLYLLDEPTTGLHFEDIRKLLRALQALVEAGNSVLVIEHNLDVLKSVDWLIDLGPEGGEAGGYLVAQGTPEEVTTVERSHTGRALRPVLKPRTVRKGTAGATPGAHVPPPAADLVVIGARQHNLQGVDARFPAASFSVVTGVSGSGKTSLAFDTLFREGQRRFIESLSTYARRFLGRLERAPVERIDGLLPAIAIDQKSAGRNPRSTVGTTTEILDYLRLLFARAGQPHCPTHGEALVRLSPSTLAARVIESASGSGTVDAASGRVSSEESRPSPTRGYVLAPVAIPPGLDDADLRAFVDERVREWKEEGFVRCAVAAGGALREVRLEDTLPLDDVRRGLWLVIDRVTFDARSRTRLAEAIELAGRWGKGVVGIATVGGAPTRYSLERACTHCGFHLPLDLHPRFFSFNHTSGACPTCQGLGSSLRVQVDRLLPRPQRPLFKGAATGSLPRFWHLFDDDGNVAATARAMAAANGFDVDVSAVAELSDAQRGLLLEGTGDTTYDIVREKRSHTGGKRTLRWRETWPGLRALVEAKFAQGSLLPGVASLLREETCPTCKGYRLSPAALAVTVGDCNLGQLSALTVGELRGFLREMTLSREATEIARDVRREIDARLTFLSDMGLEYLGLDRPMSTVSGGEAQRIRLASQLGNKLTGTLYVLDEPTVGLHPRDTERLLKSLFELRDLGNTVVAVEHDETVMRRADWLVDIGPGAGRAGGRVLCQGTLPSLLKSQESLTAAWLRGERALPVPAERHPPRAWIELDDVRVHNLKGVAARFPLGVLTAVTGVSGSGKSSLVLEALLPALRGEQGAWRLKKAHAFREIVVVDQEALARSSASCPVTYVDAFGPIRELFAQTEAARRLGFGAGRFSFNNAEGRCPACEGRGEIQVEMHFLADVWVTCEVCRGRRFSEATLEVTWHGKTIADVLALEVGEAAELFQSFRKIALPLRTLRDVGLGYLQLGQGVHTLSGGEAQRLKLASELCRPARPDVLYVLDEPTTGLHLEDIAKLMDVLHRLVERGATVIVIEHHMGVAAQADWILDLGPEAGEEGGQIVAAGPPEIVAKAKGSRTAPHLLAALRRSDGFSLPAAPAAAAPTTTGRPRHVTG